MTDVIELERTYLAKYLPEGLAECESKEITDLYFPAMRPHPTLRLRKSGEKFEMTKKSPVREGDSSEMNEQTVVLDAEEFADLAKAPHKAVRKTRYYYPYQGLTCEIDVFQDALAGLVLVDVEFAATDAKANFQAPDFCLAEVTQEEFAAGGMLCGKGYQDVEEELRKFGYQKIS